MYSNCLKRNHLVKDPWQSGIMNVRSWVHNKTYGSWKRRQLQFWNKLFSVQIIPTSTLELSIDAGWFEHITTEQKQLVIRNATINIVDVDTLSGCYHIKPSSFRMGELVCGRSKTIGPQNVEKCLCICVVGLLQVKIEITQNPNLLILFGQNTQGVLKVLVKQWKSSTCAINNQSDDWLGAWAHSHTQLFEAGSWK